MTHLIFDTEQDALTAEALICDNIRAFVQANIPEALTEDGAIRSRKADGSGYGVGVTSRWDAPRETADGKWAILALTAEAVAPVPLPVALVEITASPVVPAWPPSTHPFHP